MDAKNEAQPATISTQTLTDIPEDQSNAASQQVSAPGTMALPYDETSTENASTTKHSTDVETAQSIAKSAAETTPGAAANTESVKVTELASDRVAGAGHPDSHPQGKEPSDTQGHPRVSEKGKNPESKQNAATEAEAAADADPSLQPGYAQTSGRPESLIVSPLTHPNGVDMFPSLSATEQEQMSWEAFTQAEESIVAEDESRDFRDNASDGGYESEGFSSGSTSAESSVRDYMFENGRRYHRFREGAYNFPNDDVEQEREDMKHAMVKLLCGQKLFFAPIGDNPQQILDIGTGTGIWVIESESNHCLANAISEANPDCLAKWAINFPAPAFLG